MDRELILKGFFIDSHYNIWIKTKLHYVQRQLKEHVEYNEETICCMEQAAYPNGDRIQQAHSLCQYGIKKKGRVHELKVMYHFSFENFI